jgi:diguanylate cyclase (GGDEF)-like protein
LFQLPLKARIYLVVILSAGTLLFVLAQSHQTYSRLEVLITLGLSGVTALVGLLRIRTFTGQVHFNASALAFIFSYILVGLPATFILICITFLIEGIWRKYPWFVVAFNSASHIIIFQLLYLLWGTLAPGLERIGWLDVLKIFLAMGIFNFLNHFLVALVANLANGIKFSDSSLFDINALGLDFTILCMGVAAALLWRISPFAVVFALLPLYLFYSAMQIPLLEQKNRIEPKTGLYNLKYFETKLKEEFERSQRQSTPFTVVMGDLDNFRGINNNHSHLSGDVVIKTVAEILRQGVRNADTLARFGGEEFVILMPNTQAQEVFPYIERLRLAIAAAPFALAEGQAPITVTISFGLAAHLTSDLTPEDSLKRADAALYLAKQQGRNCSVISKT